MVEKENYLAVTSAQWSDNTNLHPLALFLIIACGIAILSVPRYRLIWPFAIITCFVSPVQKIVIFSLDFNLTRILVLFGFLRFLMKTEQRFIWHRLDKLLIYFAVIKALLSIVQSPSGGTMINQLGETFDILGLYFIFRKTLVSWKDVEKSVQTFSLLSIPVCVFFVVEYFTRHNLFSMFGGVPELTVIREGRLRCQGAFFHPIIAGCFWAVLLPLTVAQIWKKGKLKLALPIACMLIIIITTSSSTPLSGVLAGVVGGIMFYWRKKMQTVRRTIVAVLIVLHLTMKGPVWALIARVGIVGGSTAYYRFALLDGFIRHWSEWILIGTTHTGHWCWGCFDLTNQFVFEGVKGGLIRLALFVAVITVAFSTVGDIWRRAQHDKAQLAVAWASGVTLFVHCINFIGVAYFGQSTLLWYLHLAMIASMDIFTKQAASETDATQNAVNKSIVNCR